MYMLFTIYMPSNVYFFMLNTPLHYHVYHFTTGQTNNFSEKTPSLPVHIQRLVILVFVTNTVMVHTHRF